VLSIRSVYYWLVSGWLQSINVTFPLPWQECAERTFHLAVRANALLLLSSRLISLARPMLSLSTYSRATIVVWTGCLSTRICHCSCQALMIVRWNCGEWMVSVSRIPQFLYCSSSINHFPGHRVSASYFSLEMRKGYMYQFYFVFFSILTKA